MRLDNKNPAMVSEGTAIIEETVQRGAALVQQLMALGRKNETKFQPVDLNKVADKLALLLTETFPKGIMVTLDLERGLPAINGDENQLHQVLLNLCVNARDAMPEGGRILVKTHRLSGEELRGRLPGAKEEAYVLMSVSDTGTGMDQTIQRRIFEPFFTTKPLGQGTGLGLAVAYGIIQNHAGLIELESHIGRGTTFCIYLPTVSAAAERVTDATTGNIAQTRTGRGETVLFVDDEEQQLKIMRRFLEDEGYRVLCARDGFEAVETFKQHKDEIAIAVLDLGLPKLSGWQAFQQMREIQPDLKALIATGFASEEVEAELVQGKVGALITKPYQLDKVLENICRTIRGPTE
jgi:CheY-like chemotaxis protein